MSTRCQIRVVDEYSHFDLYHHCDGYPEGVGHDLKKFCSKLPTGQWASWNVRRIANELIKGAIVDDFAGEKKPDMGYEITRSFHADIEYAYLIDCDKKELKCYVVDWESDYHSLDEIFENAEQVEIPN